MTVPQSADYRRRRAEFLTKVVQAEDKIQARYTKLAKKVKGLPLELTSRAAAKAAISETDQEAAEIIYNAIRQGAEIGEEEGIKQILDEMKRRWPVARS